MQSSDLYVTDGDQIDWMYGRHRIFSFTWELFPTQTPSDATDHYSPDEIISRETKRNREALLYTLRVAGCPYGAIERQQANCGTFFDDFEGSKGWSVNPDGTDTATGGRWQRSNPAPTATLGQPRQLDAAVSGSRALVTGAAAGASPDANDLDGTTTTRSAPIALPATVGPLTFRYYLSHAADASPDDWFRAWVEAATAPARSYSRSSAARMTIQRPGRRHASRWTPGPGRRCASCWEPPTRAPTAWSRPPWTT